MVAQDLQVSLLVRSWVGVDEAIDADDFMTVCDQPLTEVRADEAGRAGHHDAHGCQAAGAGASCRVTTPASGRAAARWRPGDCCRPGCRSWSCRDRTRTC